MGRLKGVLDWFDFRTGYRKAIAEALDEPVPGGASWAYVFGSVLTFILAMQAATGVLLAMYYSPSTASAWASVAYIQDQVTLGWFIRGLHHYGASAMVVVTAMHMFQVALYGAYKKPRELNWIFGVMMFGLILAFALTGYLLPWDQKGYWATKVATGIMGSAPVVGPWMQRLIQGGNEYGNLTLTRFFALHVFVLPAALIGLVVFHVKQFRRHGVTPKWGKSDEELERTTAPFWPDQLFRDMVAIMVVFLIIVGLTMQTHGAPLWAPADPASGFDARPEWYFLPLFQLLKYFHGAMEQVVSLGLPALAGAVLLGLPFVDRRPERAPRARLVYLGVLVAGMLGMVMLTALAMNDDANDEGFQKRNAQAELRAIKARELAKDGVPVAGGTAVFENEPFFRAKRLFAERCASCHVGKDRKGPELVAGYNSRGWIKAFLMNPDGDRFFGRSKAIHEMKPAKQTGQELSALVEFVYAQTGAKDADKELAAAGEALFDDGNCSDCHSADWESEDDQGPNLGRRGTIGWLAEFIADAGHERFFGEKLNEMPAFVDKLAPQEIAELAEYVESLREQ